MSGPKQFTRDLLLQTGRILHCVVQMYLLQTPQPLTTHKFPKIQRETRLVVDWPITSGSFQMNAHVAENFAKCADARGHILPALVPQSVDVLRCQFYFNSPNRMRSKQVLTCNGLARQRHGGKSGDE